MGCGAATQSTTVFVKPGTTRESITFTIDLWKEEGTPLGVALQNVDGCVIVAALSNSGILQKFNEEFPESEVVPGDKIVAVNGVYDDYWKLVPLMWEVGQISLTVERDLSNEQDVCRTSSGVFLRAAGDDSPLRRKLELRCPVDSLPHCCAGDCTASECAICFEDYDDPETRVVRLPCNHVFHPTCAARWFVQGTRCCPLCKQSAGLEDPNEDLR